MKTSLSFKLLSGFALTALATLAVGFFGFFGLNTTNRIFKMLAEEDIPAITGLQTAEKNLEGIKVAVRTLTSPLITDEDFNRQFSNIESFRNSNRVFFAEYDGLPKTDEEEKLYQEYKAAQENLLKENDAYLNEVKRMRNNGTSLEDYVTKASAMAISGQARQAFDKASEAISALSLYEMTYYGKQRPETAIKQSNILVVIIGLISALGILFSVLLGFILSRSITKPIIAIINTLTAGSKQITSASHELASSSQQIATGASEQAAGIEEITGSMEELSSIVSHNVENTKASTELSSGAVIATTTGSQQMDKMVSSMEEIAKATDEIRTVIDIIDDIAFQTNMLALNAAVEAARAGEAGLGFAVVADEVKNLANRSAKSAKDTSQIIKETLQKTGEAEKIAKELSALFKDIFAGASKSSEMTKEVETAGKQQEEGITQINQAILQLDQVVQQNAAASEETASSAEELQSQVDITNNVIQELSVIVLGQKKSTQNNQDQNTGGTEMSEDAGEEQKMLPQKA